MAPSDTDINPTKTRQVFFSKVPNLRLVRVPQAEEPRGANNLVREINPALACQFEDGYFVVDDQERKRHGQFFERHKEVLEIDPADQEPVEEWLRAHQLKDIELRGFVEIDPVKPDPSPVLQDISTAILAGDVDKLIEIYEAEEKDWAREEILHSAKEAISTLEEREAAAAKA